jgi:DNA-binding NtrC family response regulator
MAEGKIITLDVLPEELLIKEKLEEKQNYEDLDDFRSYIEEKEKVVENFTRNYFSSLLKKTSGNIMKSARIAGISRVALYKIINKYDLG